MRHNLGNRAGAVRLTGILVFTALLGPAFGLALGLSSARAQSLSQNGVKPQITRAGNGIIPVVTSGAGPYYIEFRSRFAWDYGHTYIVFGRVGAAPTKANVAGLSPVGDDATAWVIGHYVPVPAETGWTDGDLEDKYITARYRVLMSKEQFDRTMAYVRDLQARSHSWSAELYNCNAFVADIAKYMGLKVPASTLIYPKIFVNHLRMINTGHPEGETTLVSDNVREMSNPTRDGRAMINSGVHMIHPDGTPVLANSTPPPPSGSVTIGAVRLSTKPAPSSAAPAPARSQ